MRLNDILQAAGSHKRRKRVGRGDGTGHGKTSGRGHRGAGQRSGYRRNYGYEGGQNPMVFRIPQRGFSNARFRREYQIVNVASLERHFEAGSRVDPEALAAAGLIADARKPVKLLGRGELTKSLTVAVGKLSKSAAEKVAQAGGTVQQT